MRRRAVLLLLFQISSDFERLDALQVSAEFLTLWNQFARAANELMAGNRAGVWDVRKARQVEKLFDRVRRHPAWLRG